MVLKDTDIDDLIAERKVLPPNWRRRLQLRPKEGCKHNEAKIAVEGQHGGHFRVVLRQSQDNPFDFSIILIYCHKDGSDYRQLRYNGRHPSDHTNKWEKSRGHIDHTFGPCFHIHKATQRYQEESYDIDGYASMTTGYHDFHSALDRFREDASFVDPDSPVGALFLEGSTV